MMILPIKNPLKTKKMETPSTRLKSCVKVLVKEESPNKFCPCWSITIRIAALRNASKPIILFDVEIVLLCFFTG